MRAPFVLIALFCLSLTTAFAGDNTRKTGVTAPAATTVSLRVIGMLHAAQWHQALTLTDELSQAIALPAGATRQQIELLMFDLFQAPTAEVPTLVAPTPTTSWDAEVQPAPVVSATLSQLLTAHTADFQKLLAPVLPQESYERYVALLDKLEIQAK